MKSWWGGNGKRGRERREAKGQVTNRKRDGGDGQGGRQGHIERQGEGGRHRELQTWTGDAPALRGQRAVTACPGLWSQCLPISM